MSKILLPKRDQQNREILARLSYGTNKAQITHREIALAARMTPKTYCARLQNPGGFTLDELRNISEKIHMPLSQLLGESPIS